MKQLSVISHKERKEIFHMLDKMIGQGLTEEEVISYLDELHMDAETTGELLLDYEGRRSHRKVFGKSR